MALVSFLIYSMTKNVVTLISGSNVTEGHWEWYHAYHLLLVFFSNFVHKMHRIWDIQFPKYHDLDNRVRGPSRSLEISPFDRVHTTSYWRSVVTMPLSRVVYEIFNVEKWYYTVDRVWFPIRGGSRIQVSETNASSASSWNCRHWAMGLGGRQAARSRPSDRRRRTPDGSNVLMSMFSGANM